VPAVGHAEECDPAQAVRIAVPKVEGVVLALKSVAAQGVQVRSAVVVAAAL